MVLNIVQYGLYVVGTIAAHFWGRYIGHDQAMEEHEAQMDQAFQNGFAQGSKKVNS